MPAGERIGRPVFVYGTLMLGERNHEAFLAGRLEALASGTLRGFQLYSAGSYPFVVPGEGCVAGDVAWLSPRRYPDTLADLDRLENYLGPGDPGNQYARITVSVETQGSVIESWVYQAADPVSVRSTCRLIPGGDWRARR